MFVPMREAMKILGLSAKTLQRYADSGLIQAIRTDKNHRLFNVQKYIEDHLIQAGKEKEKV